MPNRQGRPTTGRDGPLAARVLIGERSHDDVLPRPPTSAVCEGRPAEDVVDQDVEPPLLALDPRDELGDRAGLLVIDHERRARPGRCGDQLAGLLDSSRACDRYMEGEKPFWEHDWAGGLRMLQMGVHTHLITCRAAIRLMLRTAAAAGRRGLVVGMTDGTSEANADFRRNVGFYYDLVKANVERIVKGLAADLEHEPVTAVGVTPGWLRSEKMLENFGVTEANWRDAWRKRPGFGISESPTYVARGVAALARAGHAERWAGAIVSARRLADAYGVTDTDGSRPDCWGYLAAFGWQRDDGHGIDEFR